MLKSQQEKSYFSSIQLNTVIEELKKLIDFLVITSRKKHIFGVVNFADRLAQKLNFDIEKRKKLTIAALAHDLFRDIEIHKMLRMAKAYKLSISSLERERPILLHSKIAAEFLRVRFKICDEEILEAVKYHTSGHKDMGLIAKIIFVSDSLEETRTYSGVEKIREMVFENFEKGFFEVLKNKLNYVVENNLILLEDSVKLWNELILKGVKQF